jgi:hypothetical protein
MPFYSLPLFTLTYNLEDTVFKYCLQYWEFAVHLLFHECTHEERHFGSLQVFSPSDIWKVPNVE